MPILGQYEILEISKLTQTTFSMTIRADDIACAAAPGQFLHVKCGEEFVLRRPISICDINGSDLRIVFEVRGKGTMWLSQRRAGETIDLLGPLGKGFDITAENVIVVGGGIGAAPMLLAAKHENCSAAILGFRSAQQIMLTDEFGKACNEVYITTDDGSFGEKGFVTAPLERLLNSSAYGAVLACGPTPMLRKIAKLCAKYNVPCQVSLEERMGCGVGACLVCACKTQSGGKDKMSHVCKDGPVFNAQEVVW